MSTFGFLLRMDLKKLKNHIKDIIRSPLKLIIYLLYLAFMIFILYLAAQGSESPAEIPNIEFKKSVVSAIINGLVFLFFSYNLYSGSNEITNLFTMGDVNFLFPSPTSPRKILAYSMIKTSILSGFASIFLIFMLPMLQDILGTLELRGILYSLVGVVVLFIFSVPFTFLSFILSSRFGLKRWLQYFLYGLVFLVLGGMVYGVYIHQDFLSGLLWAFNHPWFSYIPIIGWSAELIDVIVFGKTMLSNIFLVLELLSIGIIYFLAVYLAEDYYEDALPAAQKVASIRKQAKEKGGSFDVSVGHSKKKVRSVKVTSVGQGPWAFLWMQLVSQKRASGSLLFQWKNLGLLAFSIAFGMLMSDKTAATFYGLSGGIAYLIFIFSFAISLDSELKRKYIFVLPGEPWKKILALNILPILKITIFIGCALLPTAMIFQVPIYAFFAGLLFPVSMVLLNLFSTVIIHVLIPSGFDQKAFYPLIRVFSFIVFLIPPAIAGVSIGIYTSSVALAFFSISIINGFISALCLGLTNWAFKRLEVR